MPKNKNISLRQRALFSNTSDAAGTQLYDAIISIIVVTALGFSATQVGLLNALSSLSFLLLAVPIGVLVDSWGASRVIVASLSTKFILVTATLLLLVTGLLSPLLTLGIVTALGITTVASENAQTAVTPRINTGANEISSFISRMAAADRFAGVVAPAFAGILAALSATPAALALSAAFLAVAGIAAVRLLKVARTAPDEAAANQSEASEPKEEPKPSLPSQLSHGFVIIGRNRFLLGTALLIAAGNIGLALGDSLEPILVLRQLDLGPVFFGLLGTIGAASGIVATLVAAGVTRRFTMKRIFTVGALVQAAVAALPALALLLPTTAYVALSMFSALWAITLTITNIAGAAYIAQVVSADSLGRAAAAHRMITMGSVPLAALTSGLLADVAGLAVPLIIWPVLTLVAAVVFLIATSDRRI